MTEEVKAAAQEPNPEEIDVSSLPDQLPTEDVRGLKSAFEKLKKELSALKEKARAAEQYQKALDNISPEEAAKLKESIEKQRQLEEEIARIRSETESTLRRDFETQLAALSQRAQEEAQRRQELEKRVTIERYFNRSGGRSGEFDTFYQTIANRLEYDPQTGSVTRILDSNGKPIYENGKPITPEEFMIKARQGHFGAMLQSAFEPYNKSSGAGLPSGVAGSDGVVYYHPDQINEILKADPYGAPAKIAKGLIQFKR